MNTSPLYVLLFLLPKNLVSALVGKLMAIEFPKPVASLLVKAFAEIFKIDMSECELPVENYKSIQDFFTRKLKPRVRPIDPAGNALLSPCDGTVGQIGVINDDLQLCQIKGRDYLLEQLVGDLALAASFKGGHYATIYLAPNNYHRFHAPCDAQVVRTKYIPGCLWPVNQWGLRNVNELFCRNERIISVMTHAQRTMAYIPVGATMVGKIKLSYCTIESNVTSEGIDIDHTQGREIMVKRGEELGMFMFGSTIILLFAPASIERFLVTTGQSIKMGMKLGEFV